MEEKNFARITKILMGPCQDKSPITTKRIEKEFADNRQGYAAIKDPFIERVIKQALEEWNLDPAGEDYEL